MVKITLFQVRLSGGFRCCKSCGWANQCQPAWAKQWGAKLFSLRHLSFFGVDSFWDLFVSLSYKILLLELFYHVHCYGGGCPVVKVIHICIKKAGLIFGWDLRRESGCRLDLNQCNLRQMSPSIMATRGGCHFQCARARCIWRVWFQNAINPFLCIREKCSKSLNLLGNLLENV
jgi:hypothetical protein